MNAVPSRQQFLRTIEAIDTRQAEYDAAVAARADEARQRYELACQRAHSEVQSVGMVFDVPAFRGWFEGIGA